MTFNVRYNLYRNIGKLLSIFVLEGINYSPNVSQNHIAFKWLSLKHRQEKELWVLIQSSPVMGPGQRLIIARVIFSDTHYEHHCTPTNITKEKVKQKWFNHQWRQLHNNSICRGRFLVGFYLPRDHFHLGNSHNGEQSSWNDKSK